MHLKCFLKSTEKDYETKFKTLLIDQIQKEYIDTFEYDNKICILTEFMGLIWTKHLWFNKWNTEH